MHPGNAHRSGSPLEAAPPLHSLVPPDLPGGARGTCERGQAAAAAHGHQQHDAERRAPPRSPAPRYRRRGEAAGPHNPAAIGPGPRPAARPPRPPPPPAGTHCARRPERRRRQWASGASPAICIMRRPQPMARPRFVYGVPARLPAAREGGHCPPTGAHLHRPELRANGEASHKRDICVFRSLQPISSLAGSPPPAWRQRPQHVPRLRPSPRHGEAGSFQHSGLPPTPARTGPTSFSLMGSHQA